MDSDYEARLSAMEDWYDQLVRDEDREQLLLADYAPHTDFLGSLRGRILDVGGGAGIAARYLRPDVDYVVVDPSEIWETPDWKAFSKNFRGAGPDPQFIKATGEALPFQDDEFEAVLAYWSLNHVADPEQCVREMMRVLKPGGTARLVLEDVEPSWSDLLGDAARRVPARLVGRRAKPAIQLPLLRAFRWKLGGSWPRQEDHLAISEADLLRWIRPWATVVRREWLDISLVFDLVKLKRPLRSGAPD